MACCLGIINYLYSTFSTEKRWCFCTSQTISCCTFKECKAAVTSLCIILFKGRVINHGTLTFWFVTTRVRAGSATHFGIKAEGKGEVFHTWCYLSTYVLRGMITWCSADVNVPQCCLQHLLKEDGLSCPLELRLSSAGICVSWVAHLSTALFIWCI